MKKLFLMFAAVAALFATSCVTDATSDVAVTGGECDVTLSVKAPGADSRATIGTGLKATDLTCAVYDHEWKYLTTKTTTFDNGSLSTTIEMRLVKGKEYNFVFWAQAPESTCYTLNFGTNVGEVVAPNVVVNYNTDVTANDDYRDAFFGNWHCTVQGTINHTVELYRPFAQINFGTNDHLEAEEFGFDVVGNAAATTTVTTRAYNTLYLATGVVENEQDVTFAAAALPVDTTLETKNGNYHWLAMNYILWPADELSLSTCTMTVAASGHSVTVEVPGAPARRNWRTNLVGKILTEQGNLTIEIKPMPEGELPENSAHDLVIAAALGGEVTLTEDVVLPTALNVTADMTINLNGHNITIAAAYNDANPTASSAISNNAILTLTGNGEIKAENNYTVRNYGTMIIDGVTIKNGVMNFGDLTVNSGNISNDRSGKHTIYGSAAKLTINGGTFHNGNPGNAGIYAYGGEVVINGGEFTIADGTATLGWTSCLLDAQGGAKYTIYGGLVKGDIRDYNKNTTVYGGTFTHSSVKNFLAAGYKAVEKNGLYYVVAEEVDAVVTTATEAMSAIKVENQTIILAPAENGGQHLMEGKMSLASGVSLIGLGNEPVAVFNDWGSNAFANQAHFTNTTVENISFTNNLVIDAGIANGDVHFKNCVFGGDRAHQGVHFDSGNATIVFDGCTFVGRNMFGASLTKVVFNNCTFLNKKSSLTGADKWTGVNMWGKYEFNNCVFDTEATCNVKCDGVEAVFTSCKYVDNRDITTVVKNSENNDCTILFK